MAARPRSGWNRPSSRSTAARCGCCGRAASPPKTSRPRAGVPLLRGARRRRRGAGHARLALCAAAPRCGSNADAMSARARRCSPSGRSASRAPSKRRRHAQPVASRAICARPRPICSPSAGARPQRRRHASPSSRSPMPASARRSTTGFRAPPRRVTCLPMRPWPMKPSQSTPPCSTASPRSSATRHALRDAGRHRALRRTSGAASFPAARRWC